MKRDDCTTFDTSKRECGLTLYRLRLIRFPALLIWNSMLYQTTVWRSGYVMTPRTTDSLVCRATFPHTTDGGVADLQDT